MYRKPDTVYTGLTRDLLLFALEDMKDDVRAYNSWLAGGQAGRQAGVTSVSSGEKGWPGFVAGSGAYRWLGT